MRILADFSRDPNLLKAFESGSDVHLETAKLAFQNPDLTKDSQERQFAKSINFLVAYGGGAKKLSENFGISMQQAKAVLKTYMDTFSQLTPYFAEGGRQTRADGFILINNVTKRRGPVSDYEVWTWLGHEIERQKCSG